MCGCYTIWYLDLKPLSVCNSHSPNKKAESSLTLPPAILENRTRLSSKLRPESDETNYTTRIYFLST
jgi:hypothetical protein